MADIPGIHIESRIALDRYFIGGHLARFTDFHHTYQMDFDDDIPDSTTPATDTAHATDR